MAGDLMARREYRSSFKCAEGGCKEMQWLVHDTRREQADAYRRQAEHPFRCTRHADPGKNLRPGNESRTVTLTAVRVLHRFRGEDVPGDYLDGLFWLAEGAERAGSGYTFGPGFNAHASDFPEGTRLVITAQILPPEETDHA